jgi:hypothetical protein
MATTERPASGPPGVDGQAAAERLILPSPISLLGTGAANPEHELMAQLRPGVVMMMGDNPALPTMPARPRLLDFYRLRFQEVTRDHLFLSASLAQDAGMDDKVVLACLLHDIANGALLRPDHGYWGAQLIAPYVDEEVAWAVRYHQALRYVPDPAVGYEYPSAYDRYFGPDYELPAYLRRDAEEARRHRWYMTARAVTLFDEYAFDETVQIDPERFDDVIGRHFAQPAEGLGFDASPTAHMWRTMIWPNNFL